VACPIPLDLVCGAVGSASSSIASGVLSAIAGWIVQGATWLLNTLGHVISSTTSVNLHARWFLAHYEVMGAIAGVVAVPMLILAAVQAVYHQSGAVLARAVLVHLPLAGVLTAVAVQLVQLSLAITDELCTTVTKSTGGELDRGLKSIGNVLSHQPLPLPTFVMTIGALLIVVGAFALWLELLVRSAAIYAAALFLPLALASLVWPAVSHWCRRLVETLAALVLSKFVVVAVLSLAVGAVTSKGGFAAVLAGAALLLLAAFTPFTLLRLIPLAEVGAALQLEGARQRVRSAWGRAPDSAVAFALHQARAHGAHRETIPQAWTPGAPGSGTTADPGIAGSDANGSSGPIEPFGPGPADGPRGPHGGGGRGGMAVGAAGLGAGGAGIGAGEAGLAAGPGASGSSGEARGGFPLPLGPMPREWLPPGDLTVPPGTIPAWEGSPESVIAALESMKRPHPVVPDGYGGIIPGIASPLWGGTEPLGRFDPGPKDDWGSWEQRREQPSDATMDAPGVPPFVGADRQGGGFASTDEQFDGFSDELREQD
jgi:type IV secretion system protein TrbL